MLKDIFLKLLNISVTAGYLVIAVLLLRVLLKKAPKWIRGILWGLVGVRLMLPISLESVFSLIPSAETFNADIVKYSPAPTVTSGIPIVDNTLNPVISTVFRADSVESVTPLFKITEIAGVVWFCGLIAMLLYAVISTWRIRWQVRESVRVKDRIFVCDAVRSPFILGILCPRVYLPSGMAPATESLIVSHELAHLRRGDHFWKPLGFLLLSVYWFNPLMWFGYVFLCKDIELACDERVIKGLDKDAIADYSEALLRFSAPRKQIAACPIAFGEVSVKERVKSVLNYKKPAFWVVIVAVVACAAAAVCLLTNPRSGNEADVKISDKMQVSLDMEIAERHQYIHEDGRFSTCAYHVFGVDEHGDEATVYAWVVYEEYVLEKDGVKHGGGGSHPVAVTMNTSENGDSSVYEVIEYWTPRDGAYYPIDIRDKKLWEKVFDPEVPEALFEKCRNQAKEYFDGQPMNGIRVSDSDQLSLTVDENALYRDDPAITVEWKNLGDNEIKFGLPYCVYHKQDGQLVRMPENDAIAVGKPVFTLSKGESKEIVYNLSVFKLAEGETYRLYLNSFQPSEIWIDFVYQNTGINKPPVLIVTPL